MLFYLFFEVFFSFIRKLYQRKSPFIPDRSHLHMLCYLKINSFYDSSKSNYLTSIVINIIYFVLILPGIYYADNNIFCKYWFFGLIIILKCFWSISRPIKSFFEYRKRFYNYAKHVILFQKDQPWIFHSKSEFENFSVLYGNYYSTVGFFWSGKLTGIAEERAESSFYKRGSRAARARGPWRPRRP